ncbi:MAG: DUF4394 domain-containing protein [Planctomycetes bacterium]|nr:DUF4394 domain-containing protein [Planctomycetota bacterium]
MFENLLARVRRARTAPRSAARGPATRLAVEALETREVPAAVFGVTSTNVLVQFESSNPSVLTQTTSITGLQNTDERVLGIDFRPRTGELYAVTARAGATAPADLRTYTIKTSTGVATFVGTTNGLTNATEVETGIDFNPVVDRIRFVQSNNENGRLDPANGGLTGNDTNLTFTAPATGPTVAIAYDRNFVRAFGNNTPTTLYGIDTGAAMLVAVGGINGATTGGPNGGVTDAVGALGVAPDAGAFVGFDIGRSSANNNLGLALATFTVSNVTGLYSIDLGTGAATLVGNVTDGNINLVDIAIAPPGTTLVVGSGPGAVGDVRVLNASTGAVRGTLTPFENYAGGVSVASGDITGDSIAEVIVLANAPVGGHVKVFDGATGTLIRSFLAYAGTGFNASVAFGDVDGDGRGDIITVSHGNNANVRAFSGVNNGLVANFFAFEGFTGSSSLAAGDFNGDGRDDVVVAAALNGHVKVFSGAVPIRSFIAFQGFFGPTNVASGDFNGDGRDDLVIASGQGTRGHVRSFLSDGTPIASFFAFTGTSGAFVAVGNTTGNNTPEILVTPGFGAQADVFTYNANGILVGLQFAAFPNYIGGASIASGRG